MTDADAAGCISEADGNGCVTTVQVNPGTYDVANGETFPLALPAGVAFIGDEAQKGNDSTAPVFIRGGGWTTGSTWVGVIPGSGSTIAGFEITAPFPADASSASPEGIVLGIYFGGGSAKIESNVVTANIYGVELDTSGADLGGGALSSAGLNTLSCNTSNDLWLSVSGVFAENDAWDHVPPIQVVDAGQAGYLPARRRPPPPGRRSRRHHAREVRGKPRSVSASPRSSGMGAVTSIRVAVTGCSNASRCAWSARR